MGCGGGGTGGGGEVGGVWGTGGGGEVGGVWGAGGGWKFSFPEKLICSRRKVSCTQYINVLQYKGSNMSAFVGFKRLVENVQDQLQHATLMMLTTPTVKMAG